MLFVCEGVKKQEREREETTCKSTFETADDTRCSSGGCGVHQVHVHPEVGQATNPQNKGSYSEDQFAFKCALIGSARQNKQAISEELPPYCVLGSLELGSSFARDAHAYLVPKS